jgi:hypothetical protein
VLFVVLLAGLAAGIWATVVRPRAFEVTGAFVARPAPGLVLIRHDAVAPLGMGPMDLMAVSGDPAVIDAAGLVAGDRVRLAVKPEGDQFRLVRLERVR